MDFFNFRLILLLAALVCCSALKYLTKQKVQGVLGKTAKFDTVGVPTEILVMTWSAEVNGEMVNIATLTESKMNIAEAYKNRVKLNRTTGLELGPLKDSDSGNYQFQVTTSSLINTVEDVALEVLVPVSDVTITADPKEAVETASTVVLTCAAKGSFLTYTWMNGSAKMVNDSKRIVLNPAGNILTVKEVQRWDLLGPIYCHAGNKLEVVASPAFNMTVSYGPENVLLVQTPAAGVLQKGANVTLTCSSVSSPAATYEWRKNGEALKDQTTASLRKVGLKEADSGNYTCVASNAKTKRSIPSNPTTFTVIEVIKGAKINRDGANKQLIAKSSSITLTCKAEVGTISSKQWTKDGVVLTSTKQVEISKDMDKLTILQVQKQDAGEYKCEVKNAISSGVDSYIMVVNYGPEDMKMTGPEEVEIHDRVEITCGVKSFPEPTYSWKLNSTVLEYTSNVIVIENPRFTDSGNYSCTALNPITNLTSTASHRLFVREEGALDEGLSAGAVAGIIIGVLIALAIVIGIVMHMRRKKEIPSPY